MPGQEVDKDPLFRLKPKASASEVSAFLKVVSKIQSNRTTFVLRCLLPGLSWAPLLVIVVVLLVGFVGNQKLYLSLAVIQLFVVLQSFNKNWSFIMGTITTENPFMTLLPNAIVIIASACRLKYTNSTSLPSYMLELDDLSTASQFLSNLNFWSLLFSSVSSVLIAFGHLPRILQSYHHTRLALHHAGYPLSPSFSSRYCVPILFELSPLVSLFSRRPLERVLKNVVYGTVSDIPLASLAPILRPFHSVNTLKAPQSSSSSSPGSIPSQSSDLLNLTCDIYVTSRSSSPRRRPVLLYVHGGAWMLGAKDIGVITPLLTRASRLGYVALSIDYRLVPYARWPDMLVDVRRAVAFVRGGGLASKLKERMGDEAPDVETGIIVAAGDSAGGHLVNLLALTNGDVLDGEGEQFKSVSFTLQGVIDMYGPTDAIMSKHLDFFEHLLIQKEYRSENLDAFKAVSPIHYLMPGGKAEGKTLPRHWLSLHGTCDGFVPIQEGRAFYELMFRRALKDDDHDDDDDNDGVVDKEGGRAAADLLGKEGRSAAKFYGGSCVNEYKGLNKRMRIEMNGAFHGFTGFDCMRTKFAMDAVEIMLRDVEKEFNEKNNVDTGITVNSVDINLK